MIFGSVCSGIEAARVCASCEIEKPAGDFHRQGKRGRHSYCRECFNARYRGKRRRLVDPAVRKRQNLKSRYGVTQEQIDSLLASQGGVCAICMVVPKRPCVDHDHNTGLVRGVLCDRCNIALGIIENSDFKAAAERYLGGDK